MRNTLAAGLVHRGQDVRSQRIAGRTAQSFGICGIGGEPALTGDQGQLAGTAIERLVGLKQQRLDEVERQIGPGNAAKLTVDQNRHVEGSDHQHLTAEVIGRRVDDAGRQGLARTEIVLSFTDTAAQQGVALHGVAQRQHLDTTVIGTVPPWHEAPAAVIALAFTKIDIQRIMAEGIRLPADVGIEQ